jgi:hypothetical protein
MADTSNQSGSDKDADVTKKSKSRSRKAKKPAASIEVLSAELQQLQLERLKQYPKEVMTLEQMKEFKCDELEKTLDLPQTLSALTGEYSSMALASQPKQTPELLQRCAEFKKQVTALGNADAKQNAEAEFYQQQDFTVLVNKKTGQDVFLLDARIFTWIQVVRKGDKYTKADPDSPMLQKLSLRLMKKIHCFKNLSECASKEARLTQHRGLVPFLLLQEQAKGRPRTKKSAAGGADEAGEEQQQQQEEEEEGEEQAPAAAPTPMDDMPALGTLAVPMEAVHVRGSAGAMTALSSAPVSVLDRLKSLPATKSAAATQAAEAQILERLQNSHTIQDVVAAKMLSSNMLPRPDATPEQDRDKCVAFQNKCNATVEAVRKLAPGSLEAQAAQFYLNSEPLTREQSESAAYKLVFFPIAVAGAKAILRTWHEPAVKSLTEALADTKKECQAIVDQIRQERDERVKRATDDADHQRTKLHELEKAHKLLVASNKRAAAEDSAPPPSKKAANSTITTKSTPPSPARPPAPAAAAASTTLEDDEY